MAALRPPLVRRLLVGRGRCLHIAATPSTSSITGLVDLLAPTQAIPKLSGAGPFPAGNSLHPPPNAFWLTRMAEITFEVLGAPHSLLSVALPASSNLCTRRGTLVALNGRAAEATSTLAVLWPGARAPRAPPVLYQRVSSPSPLTCLLATNTPHTTFCVLTLDGSAAWTLAQPAALLAWSGHGLAVRPAAVAGRGLVALAGRGNVYRVVLQPGEEFLARASSLLAYSVPPGAAPSPSRLPTPARRLRLQVPPLVTRRLPAVPWLVAVRTSRVWAWLGRAVWAAKTAVWGRRAFLRFVGPATLLLQSRTGGRLRDLVSREDLGELADLEPGALAAATTPPTPLTSPPPSPPPLSPSSSSSPPSSRAPPPPQSSSSPSQPTPPPPQQQIPGHKAIGPLSAKTGRQLRADKTAEQALAAASQAAALAAPTLAVRRSNAGRLKRVIVSRDGSVEFEDSDFTEFQLR